MKALTPREVQLGELEVMKALDEICDRLNLRYFLTYGTLLGAVRHQGFIPWDDDVDVMMPRPDYEKLIAYLMEHAKEIAPLKLMHYKTNKKYIYPIARLVDTRYWIDYHGAADYGLGLFVDIYPLDGCGNTPEEATQIMEGSKKAVSMIDLAGRDKFYRSASGGFVRNVAKFAAYCYGKLLGANHFAAKLDTQGKNRPYDSTYVNLTTWFTAVKPFRKELFDQVERMQFEDAMLWVPTRYDEILTQCYGDYMKLPPADQQIAHHNYTAYLLEDADACVANRT
ncbi:MAG: LicD family protein [Oscillospiraceae bacterium]|nr:LicD family protein [Oscillospiraceae bacterium]